MMWVVIGLVAGLLTKWLLIPGSSEGPAGAMLLGTTGALIGGVFAQGFGWQSGSTPEDLVLVMIGVMLTLVTYARLAETGNTGRDF